MLNIACCMTDCYLISSPSRDIPSAAADAVSCTAGSDFDLSNFNRDCDETVYLDDVASDLESTGSVVASVKLVVGIVVVFAAAWLN